jgi:3-methyl-2-oxobutanoate hydroxymethyltransferase
MTVPNQPTQKIIPSHLIAKKRSGLKIFALTAYDYPLARLVDEAGVDIILVGDSVGNVVLGYPDTTHVTISDMLHHLRAVVRAKPRAIVAVDMPIGSFSTAETAVRNALMFVQAGAEAVKIEGGKEIKEIIKAVVEAGVPVIAHIGLLPQRVHSEGGYRMKGKTPEEQQWLMESAKALVEAGVFAIVLELVPAGIAEAITHSVPIPTIGIGAGPHCDGQILVTHDLVGYTPWVKLRHVTPLAQVGQTIIDAIKEWKRRVEKSQP